MLNSELFDAIIKVIQKDGREYFTVTMDSIEWTVEYRSAPSLHLAHRRLNHDFPPLNHSYFIFYHNHTLLLTESNPFLLNQPIHPGTLRHILINLYNILYVK